MNKKFKNLFLAGALVLGLAGVAVSCTDYDDDINKLQSDLNTTNSNVSTLQGTVQELQNKINAGFVITGVSALTGEPGGWEFTTSDGKKYQVTNGKDGKDGKDGEKGAQGDPGKDGIWFTPDATTGTWIKHEMVDGEEVTTDTEQSILPEGYIDVEFDAETNTLTITVGEEEFEIKLAGSSASFVFVPSVVVDGVNGLEIKSFSSAIYQPVDEKKLDSKDEKWQTKEAARSEAWAKYQKEHKDEFKDMTAQESKDAEFAWSVENGYLVSESVPAKASYHVNSDLPFGPDDDYSFITRDAKVLTRTEKSEDFGMQAEFESYVNGILTVNVTYVGRPASVSKTDNHITLFALQVTKDGKTYTSDYATFIANDIMTPKIADPFKIVATHKKSLAAYGDEEHYRRGTAGISGTDDGSDFNDYEDTDRHEFFANTDPAYVAPWVVSDANTPEGFAFAKSTCDTTVAFDGVLDLNQITIPHYEAKGDWCYKPSDCVPCEGDGEGEGEEGSTDDPTPGDVIPSIPSSPTTGTMASLLRTRAEGEDGIENCLEMTLEEMAEFGLHFEYEVVKNFVTGKPATDQSHFVTHEDYKIADGMFIPRVYETAGIAAVGRTPIIRVKLMHGEDIINVAYIKVFIDESVEEDIQVELVPRRDAKDDGENVFHFNCDGDSLFTTVHDMNVEVYNKKGLKKQDFHSLYDTLVVVLPKGVEDTIGTLTDVCIDPVEGTHVVKWTLSPEDMWEYAGEEVSIIARYQNKETKSGFNILLKATVGDEISKTVKLTHAGNYIPERWTSGYEATKYNVLAPASGDTVSTHAQMVVNVNSSFFTNKEGKVYADEARKVPIDSIVYFFCKPHDEKIEEIGDLKVEFFVEDPKDTDPEEEEEGEGLTSILKAVILDADKKAVTDTQIVAVIFNDFQNNEYSKDEITKLGGLKLNDPVKYNNVFVWAKSDVADKLFAKLNKDQTDSQVADTLINTGVMYTYIGAKAYLCSKTDNPKELDVTFDDADHFRANILRPLDLTTKSAEGFIDAVNYGDPGSYIDIQDLLDPIDWRDYKFINEFDSNKKPIPGKQNAFLWKYYGPFNVIVDTDNIETDWGGKRAALEDANLVIKQIAAGEKMVDPQSGVEKEVPANESGYLTYKNSGVNVTADFNLYVKAKVGYGFGWINSDWITVPVAKTIGGQNDSSASGEGGETPGGDEPGGDEPGGDEPGGDEPGGDQPGGDQPGGETPGEGGETPGEGGETTGTEGGE